MALVWPRPLGGKLAQLIFFEQISSVNSTFLWGTPYTPSRFGQKYGTYESYHGLSRRYPQRSLLYITYLPHRAVAEVSKDKEPIGRECAEFNWFESQLVSDSNELRVKWFGIQKILVVNWFEIQLIWLSIDLRFNWFGCQSMCASNDFGCLLIWTSSGVVVNWFEIQLIRLSIDLRFKWFGCQSIWDSNELVVNWFEIQVIWMSNDLRFKWFGCQLMCDSNDFVKRSFSARLPSKTKLWSSKTKRFCETSFKNETLKIKSEVFLRDFLQKRSFEAQHRSLFCETSFKNETLKFKNETFVRDFLQKWSFEDQKRSISARLPSKMTCWPHAWPQNYNTSYRFSSLCFKSTAPATKKLSRGIRSPVTATRNDQCKVTLPWHEICNPSTDSASKASNIDITKHEIIAPATRNASFRSLFKSPTPANVFATLTNSCACHAFWNVSKSLRLPRENHFEPQKVVRDPGVLTILTSKSFSCAGVVQILPASTSKSRPRLSVFNDFDFQIVLARRRGANFADFNFQKCSEGVSF